MTTQNSNKSLKFLFVATALFLACSFSSFSQFREGRLSAGVDIGVPIAGYFTDVSSVGFGGYVMFEAPIAPVPRLNWTAQTGFLIYGGKTYYGSSTTVSMVPVLGGVRYYMDSRFSGFYFSGDVGFTVIGAGSRDYNGNGDPYYYGGGTRATLAPGVGYHLANIDFGARIVAMSDFSYFNIRAAYVWPSFGRR